MGIVLGVLSSLCLTIQASLRRPYTLVQHEDHYLLSIRKEMSFLSKVLLKQRLDAIPDQATVILDGSRADFLDPDVRDVIEAFVASAPERGIQVESRKLPPEKDPHQLFSSWAASVRRLRT